MNGKVVLAGMAAVLFVAGGIVSWQGGPLILAISGMVLGVGILLVLLFASLRDWHPTKGSNPEAQQAEARLWSTLNNNRR